MKFSEAIKAIDAGCAKFYRERWAGIIKRPVDTIKNMFVCDHTDVRRTLEALRRIYNEKATTTYQRSLYAPCLRALGEDESFEEAEKKYAGEEIDVLYTVYKNTETCLSALDSTNAIQLEEREAYGNILGFIASIDVYDRGPIVSLNARENLALSTHTFEHAYIAHLHGLHWYSLRWDDTRWLQSTLLAMGSKDTTVLNGVAVTLLAASDLLGCIDEAVQELVNEYIRVDTALTMLSVLPGYSSTINAVPEQYRKDLRKFIKNMLKSSVKISSHGKFDRYENSMLH